MPSTTASTVSRLSLLKGLSGTEIISQLPAGLCNACWFDLYALNLVILLENITYGLKLYLQLLQIKKLIQNSL
jgi:hypothetical protein